MSLVDIGLFALLFLILVFIHELGHFLMAKAVGIKVEKFSLGMGPKLFSFKKGDTEYKLELLPLGGYVKMAGDDPTKEYTEEEKKRGFLAKTPPQKLLVVFGGPVFNLLLPIIIFGLTVATGIPVVRAVIGTIEPSTPAAIAGLQSGDRIISVDGEPMTKFHEVEEIIESGVGKKLTLQIERRNLTTGKLEELSKTLEPKLFPSKNKFGEDVQIGKMGASPAYTVPQIFFESDSSLLAKAGLKPFDRIQKINEVEILTEDQMKAVLSHLKSGPITFVADREGQTVTASLVLPAGSKSVFDRLGWKSTELVLGAVDKGSPADKAGLKVHDFLISIDKLQLKEWDDLAKKIRGSEGKPLLVKWSRKGEIMTASISPELVKTQDPMMGAGDPVYRVGISPMKMAETSLMVERNLNPIAWAKRGFSETWTMTKLTVVALSKLFTGELSMKLLGGPIMIYKVAGNSYRMAGGGYLGWYSFLTTLAMLSITLGLFNLLPVPVLDGGHAVFFMLEWLRGKPVSLRVMEIASQVGIFLLIALFGIALFNDFTRYLLDYVVKIFQ